MAHALTESGIEGETESLAYAVVFGEMEGGAFDWTNLRWVERNG